MSDDKWQKVREIFDSAIRRKPEERPHIAAADFVKPTAATLLTLARGTQIGHYEVIQQIGAGGMGEVYLAHDNKLDRKVAVKILNERFSRDESNLQRFVREAKAASALNHPNILIIHEIGESGNVHYIVSEFIKGKTLREVLQGKSPLKLSEILDLAIQIAGALAAAHEAHLAHRDIKPENIMLRHDGFVKVLDFGLAKLVEEKNKSVLGLEESTAVQNQTAKGIILGTINYMSPEQAKGERVDERTDVFSFGVVIYEMIAGRTPFAGDSMSETFANLINAEPQPLNRFSANVPDELQRITSKMLRKNRNERYQTMRDVLTDLKDLRENITLDQRLDKSRSPESKNATEILRATTGDANFQTNETQPSFSLAIKRHKPFAAIASLVLLGGIAAFVYYFYVVQPKTTTSDGRKSIAVLPLKPIGAANRDEIYEVGIADSLINKLGAMKGFVVRPLSSIRKYTDISQDPIAAGREQQVDYILASNYQLANGKIRVTSELLNVASGEIVETYKSGEKNAGDVFATQDQIAGEVGNILLARFAATENNNSQTKRGTTNEEAYRLYLQGMYFYDKRTRPDAYKAIEVLEQAVRLDPNYAQAWARLAHAHRYRMNLDISSDIPEESQKLMEAVNKALALDNNISEAYSALCDNKLNYEYDFAAAETACRRAIELKPDSAVARNIYARFLMSRGRFDDAISEIKTAIDLEPTSYFPQIVYAVCLIEARRFEEAFRQMDRLAELNPGNAFNLYSGNNNALMVQESPANAFERTMKYLKLSNADDKTLQLYQTIYQTDGWRSVMREQARRHSENPSAYSFFSAAIYAQIGDKDKALEFLEKSYQRREFWMVYLQTDPRLDSLRDDPRFVELVRKVEAK
jgi:serine/threonine protein kinase/Tfp pilus assembly protein PilF